MPNHPGASVASFAGRLDCGLDGPVHGVKLMVAGDFLNYFLAVVLKNNEVADEIQEASLFK